MNTKPTDEEIAREAAVEMLRNFNGLMFSHEYATMSEQIILSAIKKAKE